MCSPIMRRVPPFVTTPKNPPMRSKPAEGVKATNPRLATRPPACPIGKKPPFGFDGFDSATRRNVQPAPTRIDPSVTPFQPK